MLLDRIPVRLRLSLGHSIVLAGLLALLGFGIFKYVQQNLYESLDAALRSSAYGIRDSRYVKGFGSPQMQEFLEEFLGERFIRSHAQIVDVSGKISMRTSRELRASLPVTPRSVSRAEDGKETFETFKVRGRISLRQITLPVMHNNRFTGELIQIAAPLEQIQDTLGSISWMLWVTLPVGLLCSVLISYLLTARSLTPVRQMSRAAARMSADDLTRRMIMPPANDEIRSLASAFNSLFDRLEDAFQRLRRFSGDVSHELRTPLTVLKAEAELALRRERTPEEYRDALKNIVRESTHMTTIVVDLLLLARATGRSLKLEWEDALLVDVVKECEETVHSLLQNKNLELRIRGYAPEKIRISKGYFLMALKNLLTNAIKYSPQNAQIIVDLSQNDAWTTVKVVDFGDGIPAESVPYVFDPFFRVDTARNRARGGTGIGLSLAQALIRLHQGHIEVESIEGNGSTFSILMPTSTELKKKIQDKEITAISRCRIESATQAASTTQSVPRYS